MTEFLRNGRPKVYSTKKEKRLIGREKKRQTDRQIRQRQIERERERICGETEKGERALDRSIDTQRKTDDL